MHSNLAYQIEQSWNVLVQKYNWRLITDPSIIVYHVVGKFSMNERVDPQQLENWITSVYVARMYEGLCRGEQIAAEELMIACIRVARSYAVAEEKIADLAAETVRRVIQALPTIQTPESLLSFAFKILYRLLPTTNASTVELLAADLPPNTMETLHAVTEVEALVTQRLLNDQLIELIRQKIPNHTQREVLIRAIFLGDPPRIIAADLGLHAGQVRLAKSRALERLRNDPAAMQFLSSLLDN